MYGTTSERANRFRKASSAWVVEVDVKYLLMCLSAFCMGGLGGGGVVSVCVCVC